MDSACDSADHDQQHVDTERILEARFTLFEQQVNRFERNMSYLVRKPKNRVRHEPDETTEGELLKLWPAVLHIGNRIGDIDLEGSGGG